MMAKKDDFQDDAGQDEIDLESLVAKSPKTPASDETKNFVTPPPPKEIKRSQPPAAEVPAPKMTAEPADEFDLASIAPVKPKETPKPPEPKPKAPVKPVDEFDLDSIAPAKPKESPKPPEPKPKAPVKPVDEFDLDTVAPAKPKETPKPLEPKPKPAPQPAVKVVKEEPKLKPFEETTRAIRPAPVPSFDEPHAERKKVRILTPFQTLLLIIIVSALTVMATVLVMKAAEPSIDKKMAEVLSFEENSMLKVNSMEQSINRLLEDMKGLQEQAKSQKPAPVAVKPRPKARPKPAPEPEQGAAPQDQETGAQEKTDQ
jgi:hypothetical protein